MLIKKSRTKVNRKEAIDKCLKKEFDLLEEQIRFLETLNTNAIDSVISIDIPCFINQKDINFIVDYVKNKIKPIFKKIILVINSAWFDERLLITITNDKPKN